MDKPPVTTSTGITIGAAHLNPWYDRDIPAGPITTPGGVVIGGAYRRPPPPMSADAERLQVLLLDKRLPMAGCSPSGCNLCPAPQACELPEDAPRAGLLQLVGRLIRRR